MKMKRTIAIAMSLLASIALAADDKWKTSGDGTWSDTANWDNAMSGGGNFVIKNGGTHNITFNKTESDAAVQDSISTGLWVENGAGDANLVTFTGAEDANGLSVGTTICVGTKNGHGNLKIAKGQYISASSIYIGGWTSQEHANATGAVEVVSGILKNTSGEMYIGAGTKSTGLVTVSGTGALNQANASGSLDVGRGGNTYGLLKVDGGTVDIASNVRIPFGGSATGVVQVVKGTLNVAKEIYMGYGNGSCGLVEVKDEGVAIVSSNLDIGRGQNNSSGACESAGVVVDEGGVLDVRGNIRFGFNNASTDCFLTINGGEVFAATNKNDSSGIQFGKDNADSKGTLNLNGGVLMTRKIYRTNGTGVINFNGGTLKINSVNNNNDFFVNSEYLTANVCEGGAIIDTNGKTMGIAQPLLHGGMKAIDGGLTMLGSGTLNITGTPTFTGPVTVLGSGTLTLPENSVAYTAGANTTITTNGTTITARCTNTSATDYTIPAYTDAENGRIAVPLNWEPISGYSALEQILILQNDTLGEAENGLSYGWCAALGLDTDDENALPALKVETNAEGKFEVSYNGTALSGVKVQVKSSTDNSTWSDVTTTDGVATITPASDLSTDTVKYYKLEFSVQ